MEHRLYTFVNNLYMSPIQWGIQTAHVVSTMSVKVQADQRAAYEDWAENSPTIIICQGTNVATLLDLESRLSDLAHRLNLPFAAFREDEASLGGVITCVGVLVPENLFNCTIMGFDTFGDTKVPLINWPDGKAVYSGTPEHQFLSIIKTARLA